VKEWQALTISHPHPPARLESAALLFAAFFPALATWLYFVARSGFRDRKT
jgi:hypothetical protein